MATITNTKREQIIERIKKCMALAGNNPSQEEAFSALQMARRLMAKYNIDMTETEIQEEQEGDVQTETVFETSKTGIVLIGKAIAENFCCKMLFSQSGKMKQINFIGFEQDVKIAKEVLINALIVSRKLCKKTIQELKNSGQSTKGAENDYYIGFSQGLKECFEEQNRKENEEFGLSLLCPEKVTNFFNDMKVTTTKVKMKTSAATNKGYVDGKTFNKKKIGE